MCRIFEPDWYRVVQTSVGHRDAVRNIIHVPERGQVWAVFCYYIYLTIYHYYLTSLESYALA